MEKDVNPNFRAAQLYTYSTNIDFELVGVSKLS